MFRKKSLGVVIFFGISLLPTISIADYQKTYTVVDGCTSSGDGGCAIVTGADGKYEVKYSDKIGADNGDTVTVLFDSDDKWKKITRVLLLLLPAFTSINQVARWGGQRLHHYPPYLTFSRSHAPAWECRADTPASRFRVPQHTVEVQ